MRFESSFAFGSKTQLEAVETKERRKQAGKRFAKPRIPMWFSIMS